MFSPFATYLVDVPLRYPTTHVCSMCRWGKGKAAEGTPRVSSGHTVQFDVVGGRTTAFVPAIQFKGLLSRDPQTHIEARAKSVKGALKAGRITGKKTVKAGMRRQCASSAETQSACDTTKRRGGARRKSFPGQVDVKEEYGGKEEEAKSAATSKTACTKAKAVSTNSLAQKATAVQSGRCRKKRQAPAEAIAGGKGKRAKEGVHLTGVLACHASPPRHHVKLEDSKTKDASTRNSEISKQKMGKCAKPAVESLRAGTTRRLGGRRSPRLSS